MCGILSLFSEENQAADEIIVILKVESLRQRVQGDLPCFLHPPGQEGHVVLWSPSWDFSWCPSSKVILNLMAVHLPYGA